MKNFKLPLGLLGTGLGVLLVAAYGATSGGTVPYDRNAMASWVQAIGSIAAIGAGAWFVQFQARLQRRAKLQAVLAIVDTCLKAMLPKQVVPQDDNAAYNVYSGLNPNPIAYAYENLKAFPLHEIPSSEAIVAVSEAVEAFRELAVQQQAERQAAAITPTRITHKAADYRVGIHKLQMARAKISALIQ
ncbi:hypothetical protein [Cupriavidus necator]